jgi:hypothetical protein
MTGTSRHLKEAGGDFVVIGAGLAFVCFSFGILAAGASPASLPGAYYPLLEGGIAQVEERLSREASISLETLEARSEWKHFPYAILAPAVLYAQQQSGNRHYHDPKMLALAMRIGDLLAGEDEKGSYEPRLDSDWDTYMWLEAYRILEPQLGVERRERWKRAILRNAALVAPAAAERLDFPWYNSPYIITSPNHYAQYASLLWLAGHVFKNKSWETLGSRILHRFAAEEQTPDGYWGEHSRAGPTTGYDHLTFTQVALYYEYVRDPAVLRALRRSTDFHEYFTYPDGTPVEVINDRNRYWEVDTWGHFGFSNFPDGRRYAEFLTSHCHADRLSMSALGRLAQDALYYHPGPTAPIPQDQSGYTHLMSVPAGIRKTGPWVMCLSGIVSTQAPLNQYYLDRQSSVSIFREGLGLIVTGANSKRQAELASFQEEADGQSFHLPLSSRLEMGNDADRLSLAYNTFFSDLQVPLPTLKQVVLHYILTRTARQEKAQLNLQLCLRPGEVLETSQGRVTLDHQPVKVDWNLPDGWMRHHGWKLNVNKPATLTWPVYPYNPYSAAPEKTLEHAVGVLSVSFTLAREREAGTGGLDKTEISLVLEVE